VVVFYGLNGWQLGLSNDELVNLAVDVANGQLGVDEIAAWLKASAVELPI
jgi:prophage maintenance system killer protein